MSEPVHYKYEGRSAQDSAATPEPEPHRGGRSITILVAGALLERYEPSKVRDEVILDLIDRDAMGFLRYGQNLETHDGRNTAMDLYQEILDAMQYAEKWLRENSLVRSEDRGWPWYCRIALMRPALSDMAIQLREVLNGLEEE